MVEPQVAGERPGGPLGGGAVAGEQTAVGQDQAAGAEGEIGVEIEVQGGDLDLVRLEGAGRRVRGALE